MVQVYESNLLHFEFNETDYSLQLNRWFLKPIGAWPRSKRASLLEKILSTSIIIGCYGFIAFTIVPAILYMLLEEQNVQKKLKVVGPLWHWVTGGLNYSFLLMHRKEIQKCVDHMQIDWTATKRVKHREVMMHYAKLGRYAAAFCAVFMHFGVFSYSIIMGATTMELQDGNNTVTLHLLPCPSYKKFVNTNTRPANELVLAAQFISCFIVNSVTVGACSLAAVFTMHACGQLNVLKMRLDQFVRREIQLDNSSKNGIPMIVEQHLRVLRFISHIEEVMTQICFVELLGCTVDICMLGYYSVTEWNDRDVKTLFTYCVIFISMSFNIFTFCYISEVLTEQCKKVGETAYMTEWYYLPPKTALDFILIISRSSVVVKITAGKLVQLSVATFGDVMKTSVAYVNILRAVTI